MQKAVSGIIASPLVAFSIAFIAFYLVLLIQKVFRLADDHGVFKGLQLVSAAALSFGHGANDAQKTMGIIGALLLSAGYTTMDEKNIVIPMWVSLAAYAAIALGTVWGGWKIIETMGLRLTTLHASSGVAANIGANTAVFGATALGVPISTTHAAATSIIGAGIASGKGANWKVIGEMLIAWIITIPAAGSIGYIMYWTTQQGMLSWLLVGIIVIAFGIWAGNAMLHSPHADDIAAEIPTDVELHEHADGHPHLRGHAPVETDPITGQHI